MIPCKLWRALRLIRFSSLSEQEVSIFIEQRMKVRDISSLASEENGNEQDQSCLELAKEYLQHKLNNI